MLNIISFVAIAMLIPLGTLALLEGHVGVGFFDLSVAIVLIVTVVYLRRSHRHDIASHVGIIVAGTLFLFLFVTGGPNNTGFLWYFTFPLFSCFLLGSMRGTIATSIMLTIAVLYFLSGTDSSGFATYTIDFKIRFVASMTVVLAYSLLFENMRERTQKKLEKKNEALEASLVELTNTEAALKKVRDGLEERVKERTAALTQAYEQLKQGEQRVKKRTAEVTATNKRLKQEIAERMLVEKALREGEKRLTTILDSLLTGVVIIDAETHRIVDVNPMAAGINRRFQGRNHRT